MATCALSMLLELKCLWYALLAYISHGLYIEKKKKKKLRCSFVCFWYRSSAGIGVSSR